MNANKDKANGPFGIGGWLLFFILTRTVIGPPWSALRLSQKWELTRNAVPDYAQSSEFVDLQTISWTIQGLATIISVITGIIMWKRLKPSSVTIAVWGLWVAGPLLSIVGYVVSLSVAKIEPAVADVQNLILPTVSAAVWTAYLLKSRRVWNTYNLSGLSREDLE